MERRKSFRGRFAQTIWLLFVAFLATSAWADFDSGDIAVIEADPTILQPGEDFDLSGKTLTFTPKAGGGYTIGIAVGAINPDLGTNLALGDDASTGALPLGFSFPFFGTSYSSVFTNSNGYVTFAAASGFINFNSGPDLSTVLDQMAGGFPRIAALWNDLNPSAGGGVFFNALADRALITWSTVPRFGAPGTSNTFQITLFPGGVIQLTYGSISPASTDPVFGGFLVGTSPGSSSQFFTTTLDFHVGSGGSVSTFPNLEPLAQVFGLMPNPLVHIPAVARRFYLSHADSFDQLVMLANFTNALGSNVLAFELTVRVSMAGTGQSMVNATSFFGSAGRLHSMLNMNRLSVYPNDLNCLTDPTCRPFGNNSTLTLMGQESGHQWLAFLRFDDGGVSSDLLLGRDLAHWSFFLDSDASNMEGNNWIDNGNGTFTSNELTIRYSPLDQYAMGLRIATEVPNFFFIRSPSPPNPCGTSAPEGGRACSPAIGVTVSGTRQNVSIGQVTSIEGFRPPGFTGVNPTTTWHQAFILVVGAGTTPASADMNKINTIRSAWVPYFNTATDGRGSVDTVLGISTTLAAAVLPTERTGLVGGIAVTAFATILNVGPVTALGCAIAPLTVVPATFLYQTTNPNDNTLTGTANTPADIPPGQGQTFVFAFTLTAAFPVTELQLSFACTNSAPAPITPGVNTFRLRATTVPAPDPVALVAVGPPNDGILRLASVGAFAVATVNVGASGLLTASADTGGVALPVSIALCETNPATSVCLAPPTSMVQRQMNSGATASFGVFVTGTGPIAFDPANHRIQFHLEGGGGGGGTSVAVCSTPLCP
ncbi:MAG TPA: hypothetical protein VJP78_04240 [Thermoleophilia bacterium]|nr:hypothetical protein [Thermoleophilia bacterium]